MEVSPKDNETMVATITVHEVTYASGAKQVSVLCDNVEEVRGMVDKFLLASGGVGGVGGAGGKAAGGKAAGKNDHELSLKIVRKTMRRSEFDSLKDWDGGGDKAGKVDAGKGGIRKP